MLLLAAGLLGAFVYFYEVRGRPEREQASRAAQRLFPGLESEHVDELTLAGPEAPVVRAERREAGWRILEPVDFPGAPLVFDEMLRSLVNTPSEGRIENPAADDVYGLGPGARQVRFNVAGASHSLHVGSSTPIGPNVYVAVDASDETPTAIHRVAEWRMAAFDRTLDQLRDARVLLFDASQVDRIALSWRDKIAHGDGSTPTMRIVLERESGDWQIVEPVELDADADAAEGLLGRLARVSATGYLDDPSDDVELGLDAPEYELELRVRSDAGPRELRLAVGSTDPARPGLRYVRGGQPSLYLVSEADIAALPRSVFELRFKQVAHFAPSAVRAIELVFRQPAEPPLTLRVEREAGGESWRLAAELVATARVEELVAALADLEAIGVAADALGPAEREALGLDPARVEVRVLGSAADGAEPVLAELALGDRELGRDGLLALAAGRSEIYRLDRSLADLLPQSADAFRARFRATEEAAGSEPGAAGDSR
jgi:hypothetical protein